MYICSHFTICTTVYICSRCAICASVYTCTHFTIRTSVYICSHCAICTPVYICSHYTMCIFVRVQVHGIRGYLISAVKGFKQAGSTHLHWLVTGTCRGSPNWVNLAYLLFPDPPPTQYTILPHIEAKQMLFDKVSSKLLTS